MKAVFPVVFTQLEDGGYMAYVPDLQINTQGDNLVQAIELARDAIGIVGIDMEDDGKEIPKTTPIKQVASDFGDIVSMVDIDFAEYRRENEKRTVRRNVSLPSWLNAEADKAGINVSAVLQDALKDKLNVR